MSEFGGNCNIHGEPLPCPTCEGPVDRDEVDLRLAQAAMRSEMDRLIEPDTVWYLSFTDPEIAATIPEDEQRPGGPSWMGRLLRARERHGFSGRASALLRLQPRRTGSRLRTVASGSGQA